MPYRRPGTLEQCWIIVKLWALQRLGLNDDEEDRAARKRRKEERREARRKRRNHDRVRTAR